MEQKSKLPKFKINRSWVFFNSLLAFALIIVALCLTSFVFTLQQKFGFDEINQKVKNNNLLKTQTQIRNYHFGLKPQLYKISDDLESFQKNKKTQKFENKSTNVTIAQESFVAANDIYKKVIDRIGLNNQSDTVVKIVRTLHSFELLFTTDNDKLNGKQNTNSILVKWQNGFLKIYLISASNSKFNGLGLKDQEITPFAFAGDEVKKTKDAKTLKFENYSEFMTSGFQIFLFKKDVLMNANKINNFDLALLIHPKTLQIKLITRIWAKTTKPQITIKKRNQSIFENAKTGFSWKTFYNQKLFN